MKDKIIYWDYALWIMVFSIIFFNCVVYIGQFLEWIMPKFDSESKKTRLDKAKILLEVYLQIALLVAMAYIMREVVGHYMRSIFKINKNPDKFATLIVSPAVFSQMINLKKKIVFVSNNVLL